MAQKRYKLTIDGKKFAQTGVYRFRLGFQRAEVGATRYFMQDRCPIIPMGINDIIGTVNLFSQVCIENSASPSSTRRNGSTIVTPGSMIFEDVTATTTGSDVDIDLDPIFSAA